MTFNKEAIIKTAKEVGRIAFFGALSALGLYVASLLTTLNPSDLQFIILTVVGRAIDKYVHENEDIDANGVAPF